MDSKAYKFIEESTMKLIINQDVVFNEVMTSIKNKLQEDQKSKGSS
jgi:hypothetical protein